MNNSFDPSENVVLTKYHVMMEAYHVSVSDRSLREFFSFTVISGVHLYMICMYNLDIFLDKYEVSNSCLTSEVALYLQVRR